LPLPTLPWKGVQCLGQVSSEAIRPPLLAHVIAYINPRHIFTSFIKSYHRAFPNVKQPQLNSIHHVSPNCKSCFPDRKGRGKGFRRPCPAERSEERPRVIRMQRCFPRRSGGLTTPQVLLAVMSGAFGLAGFYFGKSVQL